MRHCLCHDPHQDHGIRAVRDEGSRMVCSAGKTGKGKYTSTAPMSTSTLTKSTCEESHTGYIHFGWNWCWHCNTCQYWHRKCKSLMLNVRRLSYKYAWNKYAWNSQKAQNRLGFGQPEYNSTGISLPETSSCGLHVYCAVIRQLHRRYVQKAACLILSTVFSRSLLIP